MTYTAVVTDEGQRGFSWVVLRDGGPFLASDRFVTTEVQAGYDAQTAAGAAWPGSYTVARAMVNMFTLTGWTKSIGGTGDGHMTRATASGTTNLGPLYVSMPFPGSMVGLSVTASHDRAAGSASFSAGPLGGEGFLSVTLDADNVFNNAVAIPWGDTTFQPGDFMSVDFTMTDWEPDPTVVEATLFATIDPRP